MDEIHGLEAAHVGVARALLAVRGAGDVGKERAAALGARWQHAEWLVARRALSQARPQEAREM